MPEINLQSAISTNILQLGTMTMEATEDRVIIVQDEFVSGYECTVCRGKQEIACGNCQGRGKYSKNLQMQNVPAPENEIPGVIEFKCSECSGFGMVKCPECDGKGGVLIVPESAERRPTTGTIVSVGPLVFDWKRGSAAIYPSFAGHAFDLTANDMEGREVKITIVVLKKSELLARVSGHLELRRVKKSTALGTAA